MTQIRWDRSDETDRHTDSRGSTLQEAEANYIWTPPISPCLQGAVRYNIQVSHSSAKYRAKNQRCRHSTSPSFCIYLQPTDRLTCVLPYAPIWKRDVCSGLWAYIPACMCYVCVLRTPCATHKILKGEDGDVRVLGLAGDMSWSSAGLWAVIMVVWPTHSLLPCSPPPPLSSLFSHWENDLQAWNDFSSWLREGSIL